MFWIYLITVCHKISVISMFCLIVTSFFLPFLTIASFVNGDESETLRKSTKAVRILFFTSLFLKLFVPNETEAIAIVGVGATIEYVKGNDKIKEIPDKFVDLINVYIDEKTESIKRNGAETHSE